MYPHLSRWKTIGNVLYWISMMAITLLTLAALAALSDPVSAFRSHGAIPSKENCSSSLANYALGKVLSDASPVFGLYEDVKSNTSTWCVWSVRVLAL